MEWAPPTRIPFLTRRSSALSYLLIPQALDSLRTRRRPGPDLAAGQETRRQ
ncbi:hypothetical protein [Methylobacterium sp. J-076]|uniref:hypothetical protein n=1 Tax=Methylobacterium sp. J-076 TaxID=2836655 RepID=UPI001FBA0A18|nr:hypothetical protein [Methylobacterium sp. J-076]MCJ2012777.1 hypothetical protein [Methylobacterium sp. J-076]